MELIRHNAEARRLVTELKRYGGTLGMVPTMGYLHEGHRSLMAQARRENERVVATIFVNPTQFGPNEDFERYPRDLDRDLAACEAEGVDWVYAPDVPELYPHGPGTMVVPPPELTDRLCGGFRPGHFAGVATVVSKLFALWQPDRAYFGQKDYQQTVVIERLVADLCLPVSVVVAPTIREPDGLAKSSRNVYLSPEERMRALALPRALQAAWETARREGATPAQVLEAARSVLAEVPALSVQYVEVVDPLTLSPATDLAGDRVVLVAAYAGKTRLIDNVSLAGPPPIKAPSPLEGMS